MLGGLSEIQTWIRYACENIDCCYYKKKIVRQLVNKNSQITGNEEIGMKDYSVILHLIDQIIEL